MVPQAEAWLKPVPLFNPPRRAEVMWHSPALQGCEGFVLRGQPLLGQSLRSPADTKSHSANRAGPRSVAGRRPAPGPVLCADAGRASASRCAVGRLHRFRHKRLRSARHPGASRSSSLTTIRRGDSRTTPGFEAGCGPGIPPSPLLHHCGDFDAPQV